MDERISTQGTSSSKFIFNYTAPSNEYLINYQNSTTAERIPIQFTSDIRITPNYIHSKSIITIRKALLSSKITSKLLKIKIHDEYTTYLQENEEFLVFSNLLESFIADYINNVSFKPIQCHLMMFNYPNEDYTEPMVKIIYPNDEKFNNLKIKDDIEEKFKAFLAEKSNDLVEFKSLRKIQQKFRFIIRRE